MRLRLIAAAMFWLLAAAPVRAENPYLHDDYLRFIEWFAGDYDSRGAEQPITNSDRRPPRIRQRVTPVSVPALGIAAYVIEQRRSDDPERLRRVLVYTLEEDVDRAALRMTAYRMIDADGEAIARRHPERLAALGADKFVALPGCEVFWQWDGRAFDGGMVRDECRIQSPRSGETVVANDRWRLHADALWLFDLGETAMTPASLAEGVAMRRK